MRYYERLSPFSQCNYATFRISVADDCHAQPSRNVVVDLEEQFTGHGPASLWNQRLLGRTTAVDMSVVLVVVSALAMVAVPVRVRT